MTASSSATLPAPSGTASRSATPTGRVEVWSDIACPWCYIGKRRFTAALQAFAHRDHVEVVWRSYELSPDTPVGPGVPEIAALSQRPGAPGERIREMFAHVTEVAAADGLTYDFDRALAANTFDAHRLVHLAREHGGSNLADRTLEALHHDEAEARALGVTGVPFFVAGRRIAISGAQPVEVFGRPLEAAWQEANPLAPLPGTDETAGACVDDSCVI